MTLCVLIQKYLPCSMFFLFLLFFSPQTPFFLGIEFSFNSFSFSSLKLSLYCLPACIISVEKPTVFFCLGSSIVSFLFSGWLQDLLLTFCCQQLTVTCVGAGGYVFDDERLGLCAWPLCHLHLWEDSLCSPALPLLILVSPQ